MGSSKMTLKSALLLLCYIANGQSYQEGIILSGGDGDLSVEGFDPSSGESCYLPSLPDSTYGHTMSNLLICGGGGDLQTCLSFISGKWIPSISLVEERVFHSSWETGQGLVLLGGYSSLNTSEIVNTEGDQGESAFGLQFLTVGACSMP